MPPTEGLIDYSVYALTEPAFKDKLSPEDRQEYQSKKARWRKARVDYAKEPATADMICIECMRRLDTHVGFGVHLNVNMLQAELKCLGCLENSPRSSWYRIVKEV
jgi:predicted sugar kinase